MEDFMLMLMIYVSVTLLVKEYLSQLDMIKHIQQSPMFPACRAQKQVAVSLVAHIALVEAGRTAILHKFIRNTRT